MEKFGVIKNKVLHKIVESYSNNDKTEIKKLIQLISENKDFKEMYLLYEEFESLKLDNRDMAKEYIDVLCLELKNNPKKIKKTINELSNLLSDVEINENVLYTHLDVLVEGDKLTNIKEKVKSKDFLINYLISEKPEVDEIPTPIVENQELLLKVLVNNFNTSFNQSLTEGEKEVIKNIISLNDTQITEKVNILKGEITEKVNSILSLTPDEELSKKLNLVKESLNDITPSKLNIYTLLELKNDLMSE